MNRGILLLSIFAVGLTAQTRKDESREFEGRRMRLLNHVASVSSSASFQAVSAKLATGIDAENAIFMLEERLDHPSGDMFYIYPLIGTILHFQDQLPERMLEKSRRIFLEYTPYRGDTENHWLMYYAALLLAAQNWQDDRTLWFNGKTASENYRESYGYIQSWIRLTTTLGQGEFDSPDYGGVFLAPLVLLYDFAHDSRLRLQAGMMLDYLLADWACEHLRGMPCGGFSRIYEPRVYTPRSTIVSTLMWLYFGDSDYNPEGTISDAVFPAMSAYRCPEIIRQIATDRETPFTHLETKRVRNIIRYGSERNPPVFKTNYMTRQYCLGSLQGGILQPIQQHTWSVTWVSRNPHSTLFSLHPYFSSWELASFFPEEPKILLDEVVKSKGTYNKPDKWTGGSPFESVFQHQNTLLVIYDIKKGEGWPHVDMFFPKNIVREQDPRGWIFCRDGDVFIAVYPMAPYKWLQEEVCFRLRSSHLKNGFIVEVGSQDEFASFDSFKKQILSNWLDVSGFGKNGSISYTNSLGNWMEFQFPDNRRLNGEDVDLNTYPLFGGPYLDSKRGSGKLEIRYKERMLILDFNDCSRLEKWANR